MDKSYEILQAYIDSEEIDEIGRIREIKVIQEWECESKRIRIRTVTIVETDDRYLMEVFTTLYSNQ